MTRVAKNAMLPRLVAPIISILIAFAVGGVLILLIGKNPVAAIYALFSGALGNSFALGNTINLAGVLLFTGLAALVAFTAGVWNFGEEGQLYIGSLAAVGVVFGLPSLGFMVVPVSLAASALAGALLASTAGVLKVKMNVFEGVSTILLNFIVFWVVDYVGAVPLHDPGASLNQTPLVPTQFTLQSFPGTLVQPYFLVGIGVAVAASYLLRKTKFGFEMRIMGGNVRAAQYVGLRTSRKVIQVMSISGALAGFAGGLMILGIAYSLFYGVSQSYGWLGIAVALLASLDPIACVFSAFFISILTIGGGVMQSTTGVPFELAQIMAATVVIVVLLRPMIEKMMR